MKRRAIGVAVAASCVAAVVVTTAASRDADSAGPVAPVLAAYSGDSPAEIARYWSDTRAALSPLLVYVRILPTSIAALRQSGGEASAAQAREAVAMAESFATARDLISRVRVPAQTPPAVGELMQVACQLYRESALSLSELRSAGSNVSKDAVVQRAATLHAVGDRLIDQVRRVLNLNHLTKDQTPTEFRYAPPVPSVSDITGEPAAPLSAGVDVERDLAEASTLLGNLTSAAAKPDAATGQLQTLLRLASGLQSDTAQQSEDVIGARLALVVAVAAQAPDVKGPASPDSLLMLSNDIWNSARTLVPVPQASMQTLPAPKMARSKVWVGGEFDGNPPPIKPGEGIGSGLSRGLPVADPAAILKG